MPDFMDDEEEESGEKVFSEEDREIVLKVLQKRAAGKQGCNSTSRKYQGGPIPDLKCLSEKLATGG